MLYIHMYTRIARTKCNKTPMFMFVSVYTLLSISNTLVIIV